ncbi:MAG: GspH/FimT family protein [Gammaproteobacteria bacterium]|nr:GspH/FimT family protein [Gammaproteobacteria bacterium]
MKTFFNINQESGFTLIELMISLAILAIIISQATPSFANMIHTQKANSEVNKFMSVIFLARSEAIKANKVATLCHSHDGLNCNGIWSDGWILFIDNDSDGRKDAGETIIKSDTQKYDYQISLSAFGSRHYMRFTPLGLTLSQNGSFKLCPKNNDHHYARVVIISKTGRARFSKDTNANGIHEAANGTELRCG